MTISMGRLLVEKLDNRHKGVDYFSHRVKVAGARVEVIPRFNLIREWCWSTWNPSFELDSILSLAWAQVGGTFTRLIPEMPNHWSWSISKDLLDFYIYLRTPQDLTMFELKWM